MGGRSTRRNESQDVTPAKLVLRESGGAVVHVRKELDSRLRGNDMTFDGVHGPQAHPER
jgi:hypothetical protein